MLLMVASSSVVLATSPTPAGDSDADPFPMGASSDLLYGTFIGGSGLEPECFVDSGPNGEIFIAGTTLSTDLITTSGAFDTTANGGNDVFAMKLSKDGETLLFSTYIGGTGHDLCRAISVDDEGCIIITGYTYSSDFPVTAGAYCSTGPGGSCDAFVLKLDPSGTGLAFSTFLGGSDFEYPSDVLVDGSGNVLVTGHTKSTDFPTSEGAFDGTLDSNGDCFVTGLGPQGDSLVFSSLVGGSGYDVGYAIDLDPLGNPVVAGSTGSHFRFPVTDDAFDKSLSGNEDGFVLKLKPDGSDLILSTLLGGRAHDRIFDMAMDPSGAFVLVGRTESSDFPTTNGSYYPDRDAYYGYQHEFGFVTRMAANGSALEFSTFIQNIYCQGSTGVTEVDVDASGNVYLAGVTDHRTTPVTAEAFDTTYNGGEDVFLMKLHQKGSRILYSTYLGGSGEEECTGLVLTGDGTVLASGTTYSWDFPVTGGAIQGDNAGSSDAFVVRMTFPDTDGTPPGQPLNVSSFSGPYSIRVNWSPPADQGDHPVVGYRIYKGPPDDIEYVTFMGADAREYLDNEVMLGVWEDYWVVAVNAIGPGAPAHVTDVPWQMPFAPKNLTAEAGEGLVELEWSPPTNTGGLPIIGYLIYRGKFVSNIQEIAGVVNTTSYVDLNVTKDRVYYYAVRAFHARARGPLSSVVHALPYGVPDEPVNIVLMPRDSQVILDWDKPYEDGGQPVTHYTVYRGVEPDSLVPIMRMDSSSTVWVDKGLVNGRDYYYVVSASNLVGEGPSTRVMWTVPRGPPGPPREVIALAGNVRVDLTWMPPVNDGGSPVTYYKIYKGTQPDRMYVFRSLDGGARSFKDGSVRNGDKLYYAVQAQNPHGSGPMSSIVYTIPYGPPSWPRTIEAEPDIGEVVLRWGPPANDGGYPVVAYEIYRGPTKVAVDSLVKVDGGQTEYHDEDVEVGRIYYYRIIVLTEKAASGPSWVVAGSPFGAPTVPRGMTVLPLDDRVVVSWGTPVHDGGFLVEGYRLYVRTANGTGEWKRVATVMEGTAHTVRGLANGRTYDIRVAAFNGIGEGPSVTAGFTLVGPPGPPRALSYGLEDGNVRLGWDPPEFDGGVPVTVYTVRRVDGGGVTYVLAHVRGGTSYLDEFAEPGRWYHYTVTASNAFGDSGPVRTEDIQVPEGRGNPDPMSGGAYRLVALVVGITSMLAAGHWYRKRRMERFVRFSS